MRPRVIGVSRNTCSFPCKIQIPVDSDCAAVLFRQSDSGRRPARARIVGSTERRVGIVIAMNIIRPACPGIGWIVLAHLHISIDGQMGFRTFAGTAAGSTDSRRDIIACSAQIQIAVDGDVPAVFDGNGAAAVDIVIDAVCASQIKSTPGIVDNDGR